MTRASDRDLRVLTIAWTRQEARTRALAEAVGGVSLVVYPTALGGKPPVRYPLSALITAAALIRRRPRAVIVQNPPVFPVAIAWIYCLLTGARLVIDAHPASFGAKDNRQGQLFLPLSRWLARRARAVLVTVQSFVDQVEDWGGRGLIVHEPPVGLAPAAAEPSDPGARRLPHQVLLACVFAPDEPVAEVIAAARALPEVEFLVTGDPDRAADDLSALPDNVTLTGLVPLADFLALVDRTDAVLSLTTEPTSVARSAYEAIFLRRPLVISGVEAMIQAFPDAVACANTADGIADAVRTVLTSPPSPEALAEADERAHRTWDGHASALRELVDAS